MSSKDIKSEPNDALSDAHPPPDAPVAPYVWIVYINARVPICTDLRFPVNVAKKSTMIAVSKEAAERLVASLARKWEETRDHGSNQQQIRDSGNGIQGDGDLCCDFMDSTVGSTVVKVRVHAWKVKLFS
jgi:hypothetical protein